MSIGCFWLISNHLTQSMFMTNKNIIKVVYSSFGMAMVGLVALLFDSMAIAVLLNLGGSILILTIIYFLINNGEFIQSGHVRFSGMGIALFIIGALFKIQHWPYATVFFISGVAEFIMVYLVYLFAKKKKTWMSYTKLLFLFVFLLGRLFSILHWPYTKELMVGSIVFLLITFIGVAHEKNLLFKKNKAQKEI